MDEQERMQHDPGRDAGVEDGAVTDLVMRLATAASQVATGLRVLRGAPPGKARRRARRSLRRLRKTLDDLEQRSRTGELQEAARTGVEALLQAVEGRLQRAMQREPNPRQLRKVRRWSKRLRRRLQAAAAAGELQP